MRFVAIKMLIGDRAKYLGILIGLTFASLLITQQAAIFTGLMTRTFGFMTRNSTRRLAARRAEEVFGTSGSVSP